MKSFVYSIGEYPAYREFFSVSECASDSMHPFFTQRGRQTVVFCQVEQLLRYLTVQRPVTVAEEYIIIVHL